MLLWSFSFFLYLFFFLSYQRNALRAQWYSCPLPLFSFHTIFPVTVWAPLQCSFWTWWLMKQPSLNHWLWASGCGWWAAEGYHVGGFTIQQKKRFLFIWVPSRVCAPNTAPRIHQQPYLMSFWFKMTEFLGAVIFRWILFGVICVLIRLPIEPCSTDCFAELYSSDKVTEALMIDPCRWHRSDIIK